METHSAKVFVMGDSGESVGEHETSVQRGTVGHQRMIPQGMQYVALEQADQGSCAAASWAVETEIMISHAGE